LSRSIGSSNERFEREDAMRRFLEAICLAALALQLWIAWDTAFGPHRIAGSVPVHFGLNGQPDRWGHPGMLPATFAVSLAIYALITVLAVAIGRNPALMNFPVDATAANRERLTELSMTLLTWIKTEMVCLFLAIQAATVAVARQGRARLSPALAPVFLIALFATVAWHLVAMRRVGRETPCP
jgi:hypothetical protein